MNIQMIEILIDKPIMSLDLVDSNPAVDQALGEADALAKQQQAMLAQLENEKMQFSNACKNLNNLTQKLNSFCNEMFSSHGGEVARLAVKIAEKILVKQIESGEYDIQAIITNALAETPDSKNLTVYLNPNDLQNLKNMMQNTHIEEFENITFAAEANIAAAECKIETPGGTVSSLINEQLQNIEEALAKAG